MAAKWNHVNFTIADTRSNNILLLVSPTPSSIAERKCVLNCVTEIMVMAFGGKEPKLVKHGSTALETYLPDGDLDLTVTFKFETSLEEWKSGLMLWLQHLENNPVKPKDMCQKQWEKLLPIKGVRYVPAKVPIFKVNVGGIDVDISYEKMEGPMAWGFFEDVAEAIGKEGLFKRSVLLLKAWAFYEGSIMGPRKGLLSTYCLMVLALHVILLKFDNLETPLEVFEEVIAYFVTTNWEEVALSLEGTIRKSSGILVGYSSSSVVQKVHEIARSCRGTPIEVSQNYPFTVFTVMCPLTGNNLSQHISKAKFQAITRAFHTAYSRVQELKNCEAESVPAKFDSLFQQTIHMYGRQ